LKSPYLIVKSSLFSTLKTKMAYTIKEAAKPETLEHRVFFFDKEGLISPFHDIPLWVDKSKHIANMVLEIPKGTNPKLEISKADFLNPIKQDTKNGKLRYVAYKYPFNYGALPQTWESPDVVHPDTKAKGDLDPLDLIDLSESVGKTGDIRHVKILGTYAMIDEGETDWKIVAIDVNDPKASQLHDSSDIEKVFPGKMAEIFTFLRDYKIPDGKPANVFAFDGALKNQKFALQIVEENHHEWNNLMKSGHSKISTTHTRGESKFKVSSEEAKEKVNL